MYSLLQELIQPNARIFSENGAQVIELTDIPATVTQEQLLLQIQQALGSKMYNDCYKTMPMEGLLVPQDRNIKPSERKTFKLYIDDTIDWIEGTNCNG